MPPRAVRRVKSDSITCIQVGANRIFQQTGTPSILQTVRKAVLLNHAIIKEGHLLLLLHIIRALDNNLPLPALNSGKNDSKWQVLLDNCYAAVSNPTGRSQPFQAEKHPDLNDSYLVYKQSLPMDHRKPDRPAWLKPVSTQ